MLPASSDLDDEDSELSAAAAAALLYVGVDGTASATGALVLPVTPAGREALLLLDADLTAKCRLQPEHLTTSPSLNAADAGAASVGVLLADSLLFAALSASVSARSSEEPHCGQQSCAAVMRPERSELKQRREIAFVFTATAAAPGQRDEPGKLALAPRSLSTAVDTLRVRLEQRCDRQSAPLAAASGRRRRIISFRLFFLLKYRRRTTPLYAQER